MSEQIITTPLTNGWVLEYDTRDGIARGVHMTRQLRTRWKGSTKGAGARSAEQWVKYDIQIRRVMRQLVNGEWDDSAIERMDRQRRAA